MLQSLVCKNIAKKLASEWMSKGDVITGVYSLLGQRAAYHITKTEDKGFDNVTLFQTLYNEIWKRKDAAKPGMVLSEYIPSLGAQVSVRHLV